MKLPRLVDPRKLAAQGTHLHGDIAPSDLPRLSAAVLDAGEIAADVTFSRDTERRTLVDATYSLVATMTCQRCLEPVTEHLGGELHVAVVWDESRAAELPKRLDPWLVESESGDLYALLEDEFLLTLPIVPFHPENQCSATGSFSTGEHREVRENPFNVLAKLKK